ncbi:MAG TPA: TauD/TfdA family dioxygenase [Rhizomicrobium sp.]|nr:TauD/TfdA family dioxygenase [Rhizomicrobium sp.]
MSAPVLQSAARDGACVRFRWTDGFEASFATAWLWDNTPSARAPSGQRLTPALSLDEAGPIRHIDANGENVRIAFDLKEISWPAAKLRDWATRKDSGERILWPSGDAFAARAVVPHSTYLADDTALKAVLSDVTAYGMARLSGAGTDPATLEQTVRRFGYIRETNYGRLFEVRVTFDPDNLANTNRALEAHTDNPYRDPAPTLQLLHCIRNAGGGGATFFLDGFALAEAFHETHPEDFHRLATTPVPFAFTSGDGGRYEARAPVIRLAADGAIAGIRFNHRSLAPVDLEPVQTAQWYGSYWAFVRKAAENARQFKLDMKPGDIVIFDNERILHGRDAFSGASERLLYGCYSDRDGLLATLARLSNGVA